MQEGPALRTIYDQGEERRVCFYRHADGTFGFLEWKYWNEEDSWAPTRIGQGSRLASLNEAIQEARSRVDWLSSDAQPEPKLYQLGWATLPGLRGLSVGEFRATPTDMPDNDRGVAMEFASEAERDGFLREIEAAFAARRFTNAADAFDTVKAYALEHVAKR